VAYVPYAKKRTEPKMKMVRKRIEAHLGGYQDAVIVTDITTDAEAKLIREMGGIVIRVRRFSGEGTGEGTVDAQYIDHVVDNSGKLQLTIGQLVDIQEQAGWVDSSQECKRLHWSNGTFVERELVY